MTDPISKPERRRGNRLLPGDARAQLMREMHMKAGCRLDDAALCADVAIRWFQDKRDELWKCGRAMGVPYREIARVFGVDHSLVIKVVNGRGPTSPDDTSKLPDAA